MKQSSMTKYFWELSSYYVAYEKNDSSLFTVEVFLGNLCRRNAIRYLVQSPLKIVQECILHI